MKINALQRKMSKGVDAELLCVDKHVATKTWIENQQFDDETASVCESSIVESDIDDCESTDFCDTTITTRMLGMQISSTDDGECLQTELSTLQQLLNSTNSIQTVGNVNIQNSTNVHIGNITNINGDIHIHTDSSYTKYKNENSKRTQKPSAANVVDGEEREEKICSNAFIRSPKVRTAKNVCSIIPRRMWLAQAPMEDYKYMQEPVKYVIICHTATESSIKQAINISILRNVQVYHIESCEWSDIAYNFAVGCDGNVYEGRGWGVIGAHTLGYNRKALGIAVIGCFMREVPTEAALNACKILLKRGVDEGHLDPEYKVFGHCECRPTESPGRKLLEEIEKWEHYRSENDFIDDE